MNDEGEEEVLAEKQPPGLQAIHKAATVLFLERVYGIPDQMTFFRLLEDCFLPDLRAATTIATVRQNLLQAIYQGCGVLNKRIYKLVWFAR